MPKKNGETFSFADELKPEIKQPHKNDAPQVLLDFIQRWKGSTITWKEIRNFAPRGVRAPEISIHAAKVLVAYGWLTEIKPHQWQIIRQPLIPTRSR
jgi:hypothetical protein